MKLNKWLYGAAALAMLAACSDKDTPSGGGGENPTSNGSGYVAIQIGMPNNVASRANDDFADGLDGEYIVNKLGIIFFTGREENATFYKAYDVTPDFQKLDPKDDQISSIHRVAFKVDITQTNESLWALALVNYTNVLNIDKEGNVTSVDGTELPKKFTIEDLMALTTQKPLHPTNTTEREGFFMTNTPYATSPGTGPNAPTGFVKLLAEVDKQKIKESEADAKKNPAAEIFVERAVAKVEVFQTNEDLTPGDIEDIEKIEWVIDNTEPSSYVIRHLIHNTKNATTAPDWLAYTHDEGFESEPAPTFPYRFVGNQRFNYNVSSYPDWDMYRIYYGSDPNGKGLELSEDKLKHYKSADINSTTNLFKSISSIGASNPQYCYENTFDVKYMNYHNTTRAVIRVKFKNGTFFTRGIDRKTRYVAKDAATTFAHFAIENSDVVAAWTKKFDSAQTITLTDLVCEPNNGIVTAKNNWINLTMAVESGRLKVTDIKIFDGAGQTATNEIELADKDKIIEAINSLVTFNAYSNGYSYYAVRIKHFGDDLTPWVEPKDADGKLLDTPDTDASYGPLGLAATKNYLGRYGVLRNNWYQINISSISKYGEPTIEDLPLDGTPDDKTEPEQSIACKINILSWAKRTQSEEF